MGAIFVVFGFPPFKLSSKIPFMFEMPSLVELLRIGFMAPLDLPVNLRATGRYVSVRDAEVGKMPSELWSERRAVIGLNLLNREGKMLLDLSDRARSFLPESFQHLHFEFREPRSEHIDAPMATSMLLLP